MELSHENQCCLRNGFSDVSLRYALKAQATEDILGGWTSNSETIQLQWTPPRARNPRSENRRKCLQIVSPIKDQCPAYIKCSYNSTKKNKPPNSKHGQESEQTCLQRRYTNGQEASNRCSTLLSVKKRQMEPGWGPTSHHYGRYNKKRQ